jgi:N-ethylmaleimide reductase
MVKQLFEKYNLGDITLTNRVVMAPMTRSRAINNIPNDLMATYYAQRASAGLIITEGTSPSPNGLGYARIPGIYSAEQIEGWKKVTEAVHAKGGKIFIQFMHTGRISHETNLPEGATVVGSSNIAASGDMWTDAQGMLPHTTPQALTTEEVKTTIQEYVQAAKNAVEAGFDGVELHGANGYMIEQFINGAINNRTDEYGGSVENRSRFLLEIATQTVAAIGKEKVGVRISPFSTFNDIPAYEGVEETYKYIAQKLNDLDIAYLHYLDHSPTGLELVSQDLRNSFRATFKNTIIFCGALTKESASEIIENGQVDLAAFGKPYLSNPDLVERLEREAELAPVNFDLLYMPGAEGYTDYPSLSK